MNINSNRIVFWCWLLFSTSLPAGAQNQLVIEGLDPTSLFPRVAADQPLRQRALLRLDNHGAPVAVEALIKVSGDAPYALDLGTIPSGKSVQPVAITDLTAPSQLVLTLAAKQNHERLARVEVPWHPRKKWKIYSVSYSHQDLGWGDFPHRIRTDIRHGNIERPLQYCKATDSWDNDSKFRFQIETSEPITSFLNSHTEVEIAELAGRIREGRIQVGACHVTVNSEQLGHELLARLFYLAGRHTPDLLGVQRGKTGLIDDVTGLTWPLATDLKEAGIPYFFHGHNVCWHEMQPACFEPVFYWQAPDGDSNKVLIRSTSYGSTFYPKKDKNGSTMETQVEEMIATMGVDWSYDALLAGDGTDFQLVTMDLANRIHEWNSKYSYPRLISATMDMFFEDIAYQLKADQAKTFAKDGNNHWAYHDSSDAGLLALARRQGEALPTAEKFSTIATALAGGGYPWTDLYQAYHRLLQYHEHTDAIRKLENTRESAQQYETEIVENREMVSESKEFGDRAFNGAVAKLADKITTRADRNLLVFNPLTRKRTDVVVVSGKQVDDNVRIVDSTSGVEVAHQKLADGSIMFIAADVPSLGYKAFDLLPALGAGPTPADLPSSGPVLENKYYRVAFDPATGVITSIRDKELQLELVDASGPHKFNEYLYERYESTSLVEGSKWHRVASAKLTPSRGPVASLMRVRASAVGVESMEQTVMLYNDLKRIDFVLDMVKSPSGRNSQSINLENKEAAYVALPFSIPDFQIHHELPGAVIEPIRQQFVGSGTSYYAVRHFTDISNSRYGVTVSSPDVSLIEYGQPRSQPINRYFINGRDGEFPQGLWDFESILKSPTNSSIYFYLLNNMYDCNVLLDQRGPLHFAWSLRSHAGDWQTGGADQFGWEIHNPLIAECVAGRKSGPLPSAASFMTVDQPNVACTTIKAAEANGSGLILRFHETRGVPTSTRVSLSFLTNIARASETSLIEEDRPAPLDIQHGNELTLSLKPFGVKTVRVVMEGGAASPVAGVQAKALSDREVELSWSADPSQAGSVSHYNVYRSTKPDFHPSLLNLVARPAQPVYTDRPQLNYGGWINNRLEPDTVYYYKISAVDRWSNEGPLSAPVRAKTLTTAEKNAVPLQVQALHAVLVSPLTDHNYVNLLFRTDCESDVKKYEIHRSTTAGFEPNASTRLGTADTDAVITSKVGPVHGVPVSERPTVQHPAGLYDHMMFTDDSVQPSTTYYYRVCAINTAGQRGPYSREASIHTKVAGTLPSK